jgi:hypothetical protein
MKIRMKRLKMIFWTDENGRITPIRFLMRQDDTSVIKVGSIRVMERKEEKLAGNRMLIFVCQSVVAGQQKVFELKYEIATCRWFLYKM